MCGRFTVKATWAELVALYRLTMDAPPHNLRPRYNVCPTDPVDTVVEEGSKRELVPMRWGLIPRWWSKTIKEAKMATFNARAETIETKPFFRDAFKRTRCLIPTSGYYEWQDTPGGKHQRIWHAHGLQPHRVQQFKLSNDSKFIDKLRDVVGLYVDPPAHAIVLSVDEKAQIQALDRTQPGLPMKKGRAGTMTHDYKRHGTTTLFAALDVLEGKVIGRCMQRHRHQEFIRFLNAIEAQVPARKIVHVVLDNYAAHKHPKVRQWLDRHPRFTFHFTPTSCSWLNAVEGFFAKLAKRRLKRGVFRCVVDLQATINRFVAETNLDPKPFTWTADPDKIIAAVRRGHQALDSIH